MCFGYKIRLWMLIELRTLGRKIFESCLHSEVSMKYRRCGTVYENYGLPLVYGLKNTPKQTKDFGLVFCWWFVWMLKEPPTALGRLGECNTQTVIATKLRDLIGNENPCQLCSLNEDFWTKVRVGIALPKGSPPFDICQVVDCAMGPVRTNR